MTDTKGGQCIRFANGPTTGPQYSWSSLSDIDMRTEAMDRMGIDIQVVSGWIDLAGYELDVASAEEYCRAHNATLASFTARDPGRFAALGTAPLQNPGLAVSVLDHAVDQLGMNGLQIATRIGDRYLDQHPELDEFWAAAEQKGILLLLHPVRPIPGVDLGRYFMENSVGRPAETSVALAGLILSGVFERHPGLNMCAVHGAGFVPFQVGRLDQAYRQMPETVGHGIEREPSSYLESLYVDTIVHDRTSLSFLVERLGADHIMLGTDYPFPMGDHDPVALVESLGLSGSERMAVLGGTAASLLALEP